MNQTPTIDATPQRLVIIGTSGSGKSTLAKDVSQRLALPHLELDAFQHGPNWTETPRADFRDCVDTATRAGAWVVDGNYSFAWDIVWPRAQVIVWLDYPLPTTFGRVFRRTVRRVVRREELWNGNRESLLQAVSRNSILLWCLTTHKANRQRFSTALAEPQHTHLQIMRFRRPRDADRWLRSL